MLCLRPGSVLLKSSLQRFMLRILFCNSPYILDRGKHELPGYRTASNVGRPLIKVVTPWKIANDLLRNLMIKTLIDYL